ncbi:MAG: redoxin domain-containing protein [Planctomycetes bacterium]|nr:redoxin domain-containing protein [Planctomycetota bacterium]
MQRTLGGILLFSSCLSIPPAASAAEDKPSSPAEQLQALRKEYGATSAEFRNARTDEERKTAVEHLDGFPSKFLELVERYSKDPIAVEAAVELVRALNAVDSLTQTAWDLSTTVFPAGSKDASAGRATELLLRDHTGSDKLGPVCERMTYGIRKEFEPFLRAVLKTSPHREVQALSCLALARFLNSRVRKLDLVKARPEIAPRYEGLFGNDHFEEIQRQGRTAIAGEVETLLEQAVTQYGDVKFLFGGTVGEQAAAELREIRHLAAGKEAPDIEGEDQDGRRFKLSDYRGKVVLLSFWLEY